MLSLAKRQFWREPYPFGVATDVFDPAVYAEMVMSFPRPDGFVSFTGGNRKLSLSEVNNRPAYQMLIETSELWGRFYKFVKSAEFIATVQEVVQEFKTLGPVKSRFEFSAMPADGGCLRPHTDIPSKLVTLVVPMVVGEWDQAWGGGTDILVPKETDGVLVDYQAELDSFNKVATVEYKPNQCLIFLKTKTSWHSVGPIAGPAGAWRRSLTINLERVE